MKYLETHFEQYINAIEKYNLHPKLKKNYDNFPNMSNMKNVIFYGPSGVGKYSQMLYSIKKYSPSNLKYEKKISLTLNKSNVILKISDIHYEVDLSLLGCNSKTMWHDIYKQIYDSISSKPDKSGFIVCKYFHTISNELLENFYSYMQDNNISNINIKYILLTEEISFIPSNILQCCQIIYVPRPSKNTYNKFLGYKLKIEPESIINIKYDISKTSELNVPYKISCDQIIKNMNDIHSLQFLKLRDLLYDIFIYDLNISKCVWYIFTTFVKTKQINKSNLMDILVNTNIFFKYYNNNYRPIYHLERYILYLISILHGYKTCV